MSLELFEEYDPAEQVNKNCKFFEGENANAQMLLLGLPNIEFFKDAILMGDSEFFTNTCFNKGRFISRWGKIGEKLTLRLRESNSDWVFLNTAQPRIQNNKKNLQIIFMSGNLALCNASQPLSAHCTKGHMTLDNIQENQSSYDDASKMRTWIFYFPSNSHPIYNTDIVDNIPFEIAYPTKFVQLADKQKLKGYPADHSCRLSFVIDGNTPLPGKIKSPTLESSKEIKEDDFDIQLVG